MPDASIMRAFATLSGVVAFLGVILFILKRIAKKSKKVNNQIDLQIVSKLSLQPKSHVYLVKAGESTLLIGVTDHNINTLADLTESGEPTVQPIRQRTVISNTQKPQKQVNLKEIEDSLSFGAFMKSAFKKSIN